MTMRKVLYAKVVKISRNDLKLIVENNNNNKSKFKFQGQSAISQRWFQLDFDLIEVNFSTCEPYFYKKLSKIHDNTQDTNTFKSFQFPIGNSKFVESFKFHNDAPILKYFHNSLNNCCFGSLAFAFVSIKQIKASNVISLRIEESLKIKVGNPIDFANAILKNENISKANQDFIID